MKLLILGLIIMFVLVIQLYIMKREQEGYVSVAENLTILPTSDNLKDTFQDIIYILDEPVAGAAIFPQYFLSKLISDNSIKVVLGGQGGDEICMGYLKYFL